MSIITEKLKEAGKYVIGRGGEVRFDKDVEQYLKLHGGTQERAEIAILLSRSHDLKSEISTAGTIDTNSKNYKEFLSSLEKLLGRKTIAECRRNFGDASVFRRLASTAPSALELAKVQRHYSSQFNGRTPANGVVRGSASDAKVVDSLLNRLLSDPRLTGASFRAAIESNPDLGADIGGILESQRSIERHAKKFDGELRFEKARDKFQNTARSTLNEMLWAAPVDFMGAMGKTVWGGGRRRQPLTLGSFTKALLGQSTRLAGREGWALTKLLARTGYTAGSYAKNRLMK